MKILWIAVVGLLAFGKAESLFETFFGAPNEAAKTSESLEATSGKVYKHQSGGETGTE
jgi:hypothetical protein